MIKYKLILDDILPGEWLSFHHWATLDNSIYVKTDPDKLGREICDHLTDAHVKAFMQLKPAFKQLWRTFISGVICKDVGYTLYDIKGEPLTELGFSYIYSISYEVNEDLLDEYDVINEETNNCLDILLDAGVVIEVK